MKQTLQLKLSQHLALTPQLQQSIRLLQLSTLELNQEIETFLQDNPLLEREDIGEEPPAYLPNADTLQTVQTSSTNNESESDNSAPDPADLNWGSEYASAGTGNRDPNDENDADAGEIQAAATGLREHLVAQLAMTQMPERDRALVEFLIEALDDDGYLGQPLAELLDVLPEELGDDPEELLEELQIALRHLQNFDPVGIGARSPAECLELQLRAMKDCPARPLAMAIVHDHLDKLAARDFPRIKKALDCDDEALRAAHALIKSLNPRPGAQYSNSDTRYIIPDVSVRKLRGRWTVSLNGEAMPRLRINRL
ncbi:MAG TPA: RNA polymerase factor sigma-54, partial [Rhodocyclaceae bacterium]